MRGGGGRAAPGFSVFFLLFGVLGIFSFYIYMSFWLVGLSVPGFLIIVRFFSRFVFVFVIFTFLASRLSV